MTRFKKNVRTDKFRESSDGQRFFYGFRKILEILEFVIEWIECWHFAFKHSAAKKFYFKFFHFLKDFLRPIILKLQASSRVWKNLNQKLFCGNKRTFKAEYIILKFSYLSFFYLLLLSVTFILQYYLLWLINKTSENSIKYLPQIWQMREEPEEQFVLIDSKVANWKLRITH